MSIEGNVWWKYTPLGINVGGKKLKTYSGGEQHLYPLISLDDYVAKFLPVIEKFYDMNKY